MSINHRMDLVHDQTDYLNQSSMPGDYEMADPNV